MTLERAQELPGVQAGCGGLAPDPGNGQLKNSKQP
jgi:hypothetical protein